MKRACIALGLTALAAGTTVALAGGESIVGQDAPELQTREWINSDGRTTLADMKGEVVVVEGWKTH